MERLASEFTNPKYELNLKIKLFVSIYEATDFPMMIALNINDDRARRR